MSAYMLIGRRFSTTLWRCALNGQVLAEDDAPDWCLNPVGMSALAFREQTLSKSRQRRLRDTYSLITTSSLRQDGALCPISNDNLILRRVS